MSYQDVDKIRVLGEHINQETPRNYEKENQILRAELRYLKCLYIYYDQGRCLAEAKVHQTNNELAIVKLQLDDLVEALKLKPPIEQEEEEKDEKK